MSIKYSIEHCSTSAPSRITDLKLSTVDRNFINVTWSRPDPPNGPIDQYIVYQESSTDDTLNISRNVTKETNVLTKMTCQARRENVYMSVVAVNVDGGHYLKGVPSERQLVDPCSGNDGAGN